MYVTLMVSSHADKHTVSPKMLFVAALMNRVTFLQQVTFLTAEPFLSSKLLPNWMHQAWVIFERAPVPTEFDKNLSWLWTH